MVVNVARLVRGKMPSFGLLPEKNTMHQVW